MRFGRVCAICASATDSPCVPYLTYDVMRTPLLWGFGGGNAPQKSIDLPLSSIYLSIWKIYFFFCFLRSGLHASSSFLLCLLSLISQPFVVHSLLLYYSVMVSAIFISIISTSTYFSVGLSQAEIICSCIITRSPSLV